MLHYIFWYACIIYALIFNERNKVFFFNVPRFFICRLKNCCFFIRIYLFENYTFSVFCFSSKIMVCYNGTTNARESFHSKFNNNYYHHRPNLHLFVIVLLYISFTSLQIYIKIKSSDSPQRRRKKNNFEILVHTRAEYKIRPRRNITLRFY